MKTIDYDLYIELDATYSYARHLLYRSEAFLKQINPEPIFLTKEIEIFLSKMRAKEIKCSHKVDEIVWTPETENYRFHAICMDCGKQVKMNWEEV